MSNEAETKMTPYRAVALAEGFEEGTPEEVLQAWVYLIKSKMIYSLQGWFGRAANHLIDSGVITKEMLEENNLVNE